ncbi:MAG: HD domain-containing protein [Candidatus Thermoplasmatota archaeon]|nr:HD domain-containing protein [Candidatus Thermoplasmatota archaeon]
MASAHSARPDGAPSRPAKRIKDPVHDHIRVAPYALDLIDTPTFQRLRHIRQTGTAHLVYPGANHTRFEHSLGAHHLSQLSASALDLGPDERDLLGAAALLHDVGHGPFSHLCEAVVEAHTGKMHEAFSIERIEGELAPVLETHGLEPRHVRRLLVGDHRLKGLVSGPLDVDRIDYLLRDGHYTGVATSVDAQRLMGTVQLHEGRVVISRDGLAAAENLLVTRFNMHSAVYYHHTCRAGELLLQRAMFEVVEAGELDPLELAGMDDVDLTAFLRAHQGIAGRLARRVFERRLSKVALEVPYKALADGWVRTYSGNIRRQRTLEREIAAKADVPEHHVQVDAPTPPSLPEVDVGVLLKDGDIHPLPEASTLVRALAQAHQDHWHFRVYALPESRDAVGEAAPKVIALERSLDEFA